MFIVSDQHVTNQAPIYERITGREPKEKMEMTIASRLRTRARHCVLAVTAVLCVSAGVASSAQADFGIVPGSFAAVAQTQAGMDYTQAGGHPYSATTSFDLNSHLALGGFLHNIMVDTVDDNARDVVVDLPPGFVGDPSAVPQCTAAALITGTGLCAPAAQVGVAKVRINNFGTPTYYTQPLYNMKPLPGKAATFSFWVNSHIINLNATVRTDGDYGLTVTAPKISEALALLSSSITFWGVPADPSHDADRGKICGLGCTRPGGQSSGAPLRAFLTNPTDCSAAPPVTTMKTHSWQEQDTWHTGTVTSPALTGCDRLPFSPAMVIGTDTHKPDSPTGFDVNLSFPQDGLANPNGLATPPLKKAVVTLPDGMTINPSAADGLTACSDAQLQLKSLAPVTCPENAKIGTVTATTPLLDDQFTGGVYIRSQNSDDPESGEMFRIALVLENADRGVSIRLPGSIVADKNTGRLVTTFDNNPQLPVSNIKLQFKGGSRAPLATPPTCGKKVVDAHLTSWGGPSADLQSTFTVNCTPGLGWFGPFFSAGTVNPTGGASSPFVLRINKPDGQSDLNGIALSLPEGLLANLKGNIGTRIGTARVAAGPGSHPFWLDGPVVLEGPYGDAPFSLRVTVPAIAGPFNLGDVVVRQKIYVDPHDAHVTVVSDPLPTIVKGVPVRLQSLNVDVDKPGFMINPTSCAPKAINATLGAATGQTAAVSARFQVGDCQALPLRPKMKMDLIGKKEVKRGKHPTLSTTLTQQPGESGLKKVKVRLPLSLALDPDNAEALCKPEQAAAKACPAGSIVGKATAVSPVLNQPLRGDVFFVEGTRKSKTGRTIKTFPKLWVALRGEVALDVWADSAIGEGKYLITTFGFVPDAPISSFKLDIDGGKHGILAVTGDSDANLCKQANVTKADYDGQNGKHVTSKVRMSSPCGFQVASKSVTKTHAKVTVGGIGAGKLSISGKGIHKASRTIKHSDVATIKPRLTASGKKAYVGRKAVRLRVTFNPKAKGKKTRHARATVKRAKKESSSSRSHRSR